VEHAVIHSVAVLSNVGTEYIYIDLKIELVIVYTIWEQLSQNYSGDQTEGLWIGLK